ncbi:hypothetical protein [Aurantimonas sp. A3-2-R12]|uniref:hypothetical protein n=1 Tax=Aurantimonas sp. A3-2-R12 TaxID=3114362 RepID=UPI002E171765|nr:hypothetical protein [Aurantimonas sp. A3-2-R12]
MQPNMPERDMPQDAAPQPGQAAPQPAEPRRLTADEEQPSPEEQALYDKFVGKAFMLVYDEKFFPTVIEMLKGEGDPIEGLAVASSKVIARVMTAAKDAGQELAGDVLFHGAKEIFEDLAELSRRAGIKDFSQDPDALEGAYFRALDQFRMFLEESGGINREAAQADLAMLQQMDEAGELEGLFRDLAAKDDAGGPEPEPTQQEGPQPQQRGGLMQGGAR